jgi:stage II sporulation protein D
MRILFMLAWISFALEAQSSFVVRVLLDTLPAAGTWTLESKSGFSAWEPDKADHTMKSKGTECRLVRTKAGDLLCNGRQMVPSSLCIASQKGHVHFNGKTYQGLFLIVHTKEKTFLINCLDIEDYVFSVLKTESWPGWPLEVNKVFAIASRSYVLSIALKARKAKQCYDVKNSNIHQTYSGVHQCKVIKKAVEQTKGVFLAHNKQPITAMFDCCCGGIIPAHMDDVNFVQAPYLARTYACTHCKSCSLYQWKCEFELAHLEEQIGRLHGRIKRLRNMTIAESDKAGLVKKVRIHNGTKKLELTGQQFYSLLKEVKSFCFKTRRKGTKIIIDGKGYGHHLGLCQWGARQMVRDGHDYKNILLFYYPKTSFMSLP